MSVGSPFTSGITATPVSNPDSPSASFGNNSSASANIIERAALLTEERVTPCGQHERVLQHVRERVPDHDHVQHQVDANDDDGEVDGFLEALQKDGRQPASRMSVKAIG